MAEVRAPGRSTHGGVTSSSLSRGTRLGRYELLAPIGVGGMAKVWAARQSGHGGFAKVVAIKTILPHLSRESDFERLFVDEARVASLVRHPNVCEIFELGEEGQVLYLVMEWVDGDSLFKLLKPTTEVLPVDPRTAARIAAETCAGLYAAHHQVDHEGHALQLVHRDVSPHNILLSADGVVKVTDFGVAKAVGQTHDQTIAGQLKGKLEYMSPEQITGGDVDGRTDVFGMGGVIYEATTGVQPFASSADLEVMNKIVEGRLVRPSHHVQGYPAELEAIVLRAMANDPSQRFASADEMRVALESWISRTGPPVTHAAVATLLRERAGPKMEERLERIRSAMSATPSKSPSHTPSAAGISTSGVIATNRPPRVAPRPPSLPLAVARAVVPAPSTPVAAPSRAELTDLLGPDSGFNMDTVADFYLPDFLDPGARTERPLSSQPPAAVARAGVTGSVNVALASDAPGAGVGGPREEEEPAIDAKQYILAAAIGVAVAVAMAGAIFLAWRTLSPQPPLLPDRDSSLAALARAPEMEGTDSKPRESHPLEKRGESRPSNPPAANALSEVVLRVVPTAAVVYVDGIPLAPPGRALGRLAPGQVATLVVRAPGFEDETLRLDGDLHGTVDVVLSPRGSSRPGALPRDDP